MPVALIYVYITYFSSIVFQEYLIRKSKQPAIAKFNTKLHLITSYFLFNSIYFILIFSIRFRLWPADQLRQELANYFQCESTGLNTCDRTEIDEYSTQQILFSIFNILLVAFPAINLLYAWNYRDIKHTWKRRKVTNLPPHDTRSHPTDLLQETAIKH